MSRSFQDSRARHHAWWAKWMDDLVASVAEVDADIADLLRPVMAAAKESMGNSPVTVWCMYCDEFNAPIESPLEALVKHHAECPKNPAAPTETPRKEGE